MSTKELKTPKVAPPLPSTPPPPMPMQLIDPNTIQIQTPPIALNEGEKTLGELSPVRRELPKRQSLPKPSDIAEMKKNFVAEQYRFIASKQNIRVSSCDKQLINMFGWSVSQDGYVVAYTGANHTRFSLHKLIVAAMGLEIPEGHSIDHIDRDKLNNTRANLRVVTIAENNHNKDHTNGTHNMTGYKGVTKLGYGKFKATIVRLGQQRHLGTFDTAEAAAEAYQTAVHEWMTKTGFYSKFAS